jgi:hypothetical protein
LSDYFAEVLAFVQEWRRAIILALIAVIAGDGGGPGKRCR